MNRHIQYTVVLMCAKNCVNIFSSFLDIRQNVEWPRFLPTRHSLQLRTTADISELLGIVYHFYYRAMHFSAYARSWDRMSSVRLSVCLSVRL